MEVVLVRTYRFMAKNWNALLAFTSLLGIAVFWIVPPLEKFTSVFVFLAANSIVWTLIEIKNEIKPQTRRGLPFSNMRTARSEIIRDIEKVLKGTDARQPLQLTLIGGRIRSMSDIVRELADDLNVERVSGHVMVRIYCLDPDYITARIVPGDVSPDEQGTRNRSYGSIIRSVCVELAGVGRGLRRSTLTVETMHYREDPHYYAYLIGDKLLYWGTYTWSESASDFIGPENPCIRVESPDPMFGIIKEWLGSRARLYELEWLSGRHP